MCFLSLLSRGGAEARVCLCFDTRVCCGVMRDSAQTGPSWTSG